MNLAEPALNSLSAGTASPPVPIGRPNRSWNLAEPVSEICERYRLHGWQISFRDLRRGGWDVEVSLPLPEDNSQAERAMDEIARLLRASYLYDANGRVKKVVNPSTAFTSMIYSAGTTRATLDPLLNRSTLLFNADNTIRAFKNPLNQVTSVNWSSGWPTLVKAADGTLTTLSYSSLTDNTKRVRFIETPTAGRYSWLYDSSTNRLRAEINQGGARISYFYDGSGNLTARQNALGYKTTYLWTNGKMRAMVQPDGNRISYTFDSNNRLTAIKNAMGEVTSFGYNTYGQRITEKTPLGNVTTTLWNLDNRMRAIINPIGNRTTFTIDSDGRLKATTNALGNRETTLYDNDGRVRARISAVGCRTTYGYDKNGNRVTVKNGLGNVWTTLYDSLNRPRATINPLSQRQTMTYDSANNLRTLKNELAFVTTYVYDSDNRQVATINALNERSSVVFDKAGRQVATVNGLGKRWTTLYDDEGQQRATLDPMGNRVSFIWDSDGRQVAVVNQLGFRTTTLYDSASRPKATIDALANRVTTLYDSDAVSARSPISRSTTFVYPAPRDRGIIQAAATSRNQQSQEIRPKGNALPGYESLAELGLERAADPGVNGRNTFRSVAVVGLGKLGLPLACVLASKGCMVYGIDTQESLVDAVNKGEYGGQEPYVATLLWQNRKRISASSDYAPIRETEAAFVLVPTPSDGQDRFSLAHVLPAVSAIARVVADAGLPRYTIIVVSTVMPGACEREIWPVIVEAKHTVLL